MIKNIAYSKALIKKNKDIIILCLCSFPIFIILNNIFLQLMFFSTNGKIYPKVFQIFGEICIWKNPKFNLIVFKQFTFFYFWRFLFISICAFLHNKFKIHFLKLFIGVYLSFDIIFALLSIISVGFLVNLNHFLFSNQPLLMTNIMFKIPHFIGFIIIGVFSLLFFKILIKYSPKEVKYWSLLAFSSFLMVIISHFLLNFV